MSCTGEPLKQCPACNKCSINAGCYYAYSQASHPQGSGASLLPLQAIHLGSGPLPAWPPLHSPSWYPACSPFCFLVIRALPNVAGSECQGQPVFPGSQWEQRFQTSPLLGKPGQKAEGQGQPLSQASLLVPLCPYLSGALRPQKHPGLTDLTNTPLHLGQS